MDKALIAKIVYLFLLLIMTGSGLWVAYDVRKRGKPILETAVWGLFAFWFFGLGLIVYLFWRKKLKDY